MKRVHFTDQDIEGKEFEGVHFETCTFESLATGRFIDCIFEKCDLSNADTTNTQIQSCKFIQSKLIGMSFSKDNFAFSAHFETCDLRYTQWLELNLKGMTLTNCNLQESRIIGCDARKALVQGTDFSNTIWGECNVRGLDFSQSEGVLLNPLQNKIEGCKLSTHSAQRILEDVFQIIVRD